MKDNKPTDIKPFRGIVTVIKVPILFVRYFCLGFFFTAWFIIGQFLSVFAPIFRYSFLGFLFLGYVVYSGVKALFKIFGYLLTGIFFPVIAIYKHYNSKEAKNRRAELKAKKDLERENARKEKELERNEKIAEKERLKQEKLALEEKERQEKLALAEKAKEEKLVIANDNKIEEVENVTNPEDDTYIIHAPQNEFLEEEKQENKVGIETGLVVNKDKTKLTKEEKEKLKQEKINAKKEARLKRLEEKKKRKKDSKDVYINENVKLEKAPLSERIMHGLNEFNHLPDRISASVQKRWNNLSFIKNRKNRRDINRQALLINFEGEDAEKSDKKIVFQYVAKNPEGKVIKGYFDAFSKVEVHSFLLSEGYEVYSIKTSRLIQILHGTGQVNKTRIKTKDLIFFLTQLSTYIKAGIPLVDSLKILSRQYKNKSYQRIFREIIYNLTMGDNFSDALDKQGNAFPRLLINMMKASEMTGELPEALDDMADYYTETDKTRKQMITAMMYPSIIFVISVAAITFIMVFVVPKFVTIYETMDNARLPWITQMVINISAFLETKLALLLVVIALTIAILVYLYKKVQVFRTLVQFLIMHLPIFGNVIIYNEITMFTKTFSSLLRHNVFITDSMEVLNRITSNEIYKMIILDTITNLARGEKISLAFKDHWAVPIPAYEMIVTGERTGQLSEMMGKVAAYYQEMHKNAVTRIKTFLEPTLILFLTVMVGGIVLSIVVPMFDMYNNMGL